MSSPEQPGIAASPELLIDPDAEFATLQDVAKRIDTLAPGDAVPHEVMQDGISALIKLYTLHQQLGDVFPPFADGRAMPPTCVMVTASAMLRAINIEPFELGLWQALSKD